MNFLNSFCSFNGEVWKHTNFDFLLTKITFDSWYELPVVLISVSIYRIYLCFFVMVLLLAIFHIQNSIIINSLVNKKEEEEEEEFSIKTFVGKYIHPIELNWYSSCNVGVEFHLVIVFHFMDQVWDGTFSQWYMLILAVDMSWLLMQTFIYIFFFFCWRDEIGIYGIQFEKYALDSSIGSNYVNRMHRSLFWAKI